MLKLVFIWNIIVSNTKNKTKQRGSVRRASGALLKQATSRNHTNIAQITHFKLDAVFLWDSAVTIAHEDKGDGAISKPLGWRQTPFAGVNVALFGLQKRAGRVLVLDTSQFCAEGQC